MWRRDRHANVTSVGLVDGRMCSFSLGWSWFGSLSKFLLLKVVSLIGLFLSISLVAWSLPVWADGSTVSLRVASLNKVGCRAGRPGLSHTTRGQTRWYSLNATQIESWRRAGYTCRKAKPANLRFGVFTSSNIKTQETLPVITVKLLNRRGKIAAGARPVRVNLRLVQGAGELQGISSGRTRHGKIRFSNLKFTGVGHIMLEAFASRLEPAMSPPMLVEAGPAVALEPLAELPAQANIWAPISGLEFQLLDSYGNRVIQDNESIVDVTLTEGTGELLGTHSAQANSGQILFPNVRHSKLESIGLRFKVRQSDPPNEITYDSPSISVSGRTTYAYTWLDTHTEGLSRLITTPHLNSAVWMYANLDDAAVHYRNRTDQMPEGHRAMFFREMLFRDRGLLNDLDAVRNVNGVIQGYTDPVTQEFRPYRGLWWENGIAPIKVELREFIQKYKAVGGKLDHAIIHNEEAFSNWALSNNARGLYGGDLDENNVTAYLQAIQNDPRYTHPDFGHNGQSIYELLSFNWIYPNVYTIWQVEYAGQYLEFSALMGKRLNAYMNEMVYETIQEFYPAAKVSNYNFYNESVAFGLPDENGHKNYLQSERFSGPMFGNTQARALYGCLDQISWPNRGPDGMNYANTPFNAARYNANATRSMFLSSGAGISPWIPYRSWICSMANSDYFEEALLHSLLSGSDELIYWNPYATLQNDRDLDALLIEFDTIIGNSVDNSPLIDNLASWTSKFLKTCNRFDRGTFCRVTPELAPGQDRESVVVTEFPATFHVSGETLTIAGGRIVRPEEEVSANGFWVQVTE